MKASEIILAARRRVDDLAKPYLRSDPLFLEDLAEAEIQACRRARLIVDSTDPLCTVAFDGTQTVADLDSRIIRVRRVRWVGRTELLQKIHRDDLDRERPGWEDETASEPTHFVVGMDTAKLRPYPTPDTAGTVQLTVARESLEAPKLDGEPEIAGRYHRALVDWLMYRYYETQDSETRNDAKAEAALARFTAEFGPASTAQNEVWAELQEGFDPDDGSY